MPSLSPVDIEALSHAAIALGLQLAVLAVLLIVIGLLVRLALSQADQLELLKRFHGRADSICGTFNKWLWLVFWLLALVIVSVNGYLFYKNVDVLAVSQARLANLGPTFWIDLGIELAKVTGLFIAASIVVRWIRKGLTALEARAKAFQGLTANDESIELFFGALARIVTVSLWLLAMFLALTWLPFPPAFAAAIWLILKIYLIVALGLLALKAVAAIVDSCDALVRRSREPEKLLGLYERLHQLMPLMRRCLEAVVWVLVATLVMTQIDFIASLAAWGPRLIECIGIFFVVRVVIEVSNLLIDKTMLEGKELEPAEKQGLETVVPVLKSILSFLFYFIGIVLILRALGLNPLPLLAGAGVIGIVIGLGAQPLINDVVSGLFILFERLFLVGDFVETGGARGVVESVQLRTTRIRDPDGQLHILRNGQLGGVINYSKSFTNAIVEVGVAYDSDLERVTRVLKQVGEELKKQNPDVLAATDVQGIENFGESELTLRTVTRVKPGRHRRVARQLRAMIKTVFDSEGIEIPFARRVVIFQNAPDAS